MLIIFTKKLIKKGEFLEHAKVFNNYYGSPYDNIKKQSYPAILATSGLTDPRVTYWEATKWIAKLRNKKIDDNPIFLKTYTEAGHGGMAGRYNQIREIAFIYAFICF